MNYEAQNAMYIARAEAGLRALLPEAPPVGAEGTLPPGLS